MFKATHIFVTAHPFDGFTVSAELFAAFCKLLKTFSRSLVFIFSLRENFERRGREVLYLKGRETSPAVGGTG